MTVSPAPITQPVVDQSGLPTLPWTLFFNQNYNGDAGQSWDVNFDGVTGSYEATGRYYRLSQFLVYFKVDVVPDGNTSAVAGTTYIDSFPLAFSGNGFNTIVSGATGGAVGMNRASDKRIYVPAWTNVSDPITIIGLVEAS